MGKEQQNVSKMKNAHQKHVATEQIKILTKYLTINFKIFSVAIISTKEDQKHRNLEQMWLLNRKK